MVDTTKLLQNLKSYRDSLSQQQKRLDADFDHLMTHYLAFAKVYEGDSAREFKYGWDTTENNFRIYLRETASIIKMLENKGWFVKVMHASDLLSGVPDLYACHRIIGPRWIEVKLPKMKGSRFTKAQIRDFPKFLEKKVGIWILTAANEENYKRLLKPSNCEYCMNCKAMGVEPNV